MSQNAAQQARLRREHFSLLLPALLPIVLFSVVPLLRGIYFGFTSYELGDPVAQFNGLENYAYMLSDRLFWQSFRVGLIWTAIVTTGQVVLGLGLALLLNANLRMRWLARTLVLVPWAMPPVIKGMMWRWLYHPNAGIINHSLMQVGIIDHPINWLANFTYTLPAVLIVGIWSGMPQATVTLLAGLQTVPGDLYEAAAIDGAGLWRQFKDITLPMLRPVLVAIISLECIWNFNSFGLVYVLTEGGPSGRTRLPMLAAYEEAFRYGKFGYAAALGNMMVLVILGLLYLYLRNQWKQDER